MVIATVAFWFSVALGSSFELVAQSQSQEALPSLAIDDNGVVAIWDDTATRAGRVNAMQPISDATTLVGEQSRQTAAASIGNQTMVAWLHNDDLFAQIIGSDGKPVGPPIDIAFVDSRHTQRFAIAASRDRYLILYEAASRVIGAILDANGKVLNYFLQLSGGEYGHNVERISIASNGSDFLAVWDVSSAEPWVTPCTLVCPSDDREVRAVLVDDEGNPVPGTERTLSTSAADPAVAANGRDYLVAWTRLGGGISGQTIGAGFATVGDPVTITIRQDYGPHLAWDGTLYDLAWINNDNGLALAADRIKATGNIVEPLLTSTTFIGFVPRDFDLAARDGKVILAVPAGGHLRLQYVTVTPPTPARIRAVRH
jgi:hypothetical protein